MAWGIFYMLSIWSTTYKAASWQEFSSWTSTQNSKFHGFTVPLGEENLTGVTEDSYKRNFSVDILYPTSDPELTRKIPWNKHEVDCEAIRALIDVAFLRDHPQIKVKLNEVIELGKDMTLRYSETKDNPENAYLQGDYNYWLTSFVAKSGPYSLFVLAGPAFAYDEPNEVISITIRRNDCRPFNKAELAEVNRYRVRAVCNLEGENGEKIVSEPLRFHFDKERKMSCATFVLGLEDSSLKYNLDHVDFQSSKKLIELNLTALNVTT